ncbi:MAG: HAMP domain-containing histidine kinase [Chloroflexi bacterium]|nr:HAMP domain-containing histidine kinase [Chloroflexota bacterium]
MKIFEAFPPLSLRVKLVLSYLLVALGAILILAIAITLAVQNYFANAQLNALQNDAKYLAQQLGQFYYTQGEDWNNIPPIPSYRPDILEIIIDTNNNAHSLPPTSFIKLDQMDAPTLNEALTKALHGQEADGRLEGSADGHGFLGLYVCVPLRDNGLEHGKIIGALLLAEPEMYHKGFPPADFLFNVNQTIVITGIVIGFAVILMSLVLARGLTNPLESLTLAAEQMRDGNYAKRVVPPRTKDELERLASTFNAMADTIEADITELRNQEQLRRDLIANIAHDLVTPLSSIQGYSEALADDVISEPQARQETAQLISREVQRLRRLVGDMQNMSILESGRVQLDLAPLDLHDLVDETLAVIGPECEEAHIVVRNEIAPTMPLVLADSNRIIQVLLNLLDNAHVHTPAGGNITIGAKLATRKANANVLTVWVSDTGVGINPADLPFIFERFYRGDRARTGSAKNSGLGLAIVKAIITAHGGIVHAESKPGQGTRIMFTLPLATGHDTPSPRHFSS